MSRLDFLILSILSKNEAFDKRSAMTIREIMEADDFGYKSNTIFKRMEAFETMGYVLPGYKEGNAKTYYLSNAGRDFLKNN